MVTSRLECTRPKKPSQPVVKGWFSYFIVNTRRSIDTIVSLRRAIPRPSTRPPSCQHPVSAAPELVGDADDAMPSAITTVITHDSHCPDIANISTQCANIEISYTTSVVRPIKFHGMCLTAALLNSQSARNTAADSNAKKFLDLLNLLNFSQHVTSTTHKAGHTLDLVITRDSEAVIDNVTVSDLLSDHVLFWPSDAMRRPCCDDHVRRPFCLFGHVTPHGPIRDALDGLTSPQPR